MIEENRNPISKRCTFRRAFHGQGVDAYTSSEVKKRYARSLEKLADKFFWAPIAALLATGFTSSLGVFAAQCVLAGVFVFLGIYLRHCAYVVYETLPNKRARRKAFTT